MIKFDYTFVFVVLLNVALLVLRFTVGTPEGFSGNLLSTLIFAVIFVALFITLFTERFDQFIIIWLSFYFAAPIIKLPFTSVGSLGLLNGVFLPLMILFALDLKNYREYIKDPKKLLILNNGYIIVIGLLFLASLMNLSSVGLRILFSDLFELIAPMVFVFFVVKKGKNYNLIIKNIVLIALLNAPLGFYEFLFRPEWGVQPDWRTVRIFGNLFWHNSYSYFLLPVLMVLYLNIRQKFNIVEVMLLGLLGLLDVLTFSRGGFLALVISLFVFEMMFRTGFKLTVKKVVLVFLLLGSVFAYYQLSNYLDSHYQPDSLVERTAIWKTVIPFIKEKPIFGNGLGSYELYRNQILHSLSTHNYYLNIMFQLGLVGIGIFGLFILLLLVSLARKIIVVPFRAGLSELGISLIAAILGYSLIGNAAFVQVVSLNTWILIGCCIGHHEKK